MGLRRRGPGLIRSGAALLAGLLAACAGLSEAEQAKLGMHRENAREFFQAGRYQNALQQATLALLLDDADVSMRLVRGHSLLRLGAATRNAAQLEEALVTFADLADDEPADDRAALSLASAQLARSLLLQDEVDALRERLRSEFLPADGRGVEERRLQGLVGRREQLLADAEQGLRRVLANPLQKDNPGGLTDLVLVLHAQGGREEEALELAGRILELLDESSDLARITLDKTPGRSATSRLELQNLLDKNREKELALRELVATAALQRGATDVYLAQMELAEERGLLGEVQYWNRAGVFERLLRYAEAADDLDQFLRLRARRFARYEDDPQAAEAFRRIEDLRGRAATSPR
jgi:tetratricopeptide (TPR) repeat protein